MKDSNAGLLTNQANLSISFLSIPSLVNENVASLFLPGKAVLIDLEDDLSMLGYLKNEEYGLFYIENFSDSVRKFDTSLKSFHKAMMFLVKQESTSKQKSKTETKNLRYGIVRFEFSSHWNMTTNLSGKIIHLTSNVQQSISKHSQNENTDVLFGVINELWWWSQIACQLERKSGNTISQLAPILSQDYRWIQPIHHNLPNEKERGGIRTASQFRYSSRKAIRVHVKEGSRWQWLWIVTVVRYVNEKGV